MTPTIFALCFVFIILFILNKISGLGKQPELQLVEEEGFRSFSGSGFSRPCNHYTQHTQTLDAYYRRVRRRKEKRLRKR